MTSLKCSAHNCCYNKNSLCSRGSISVEGADARYADDTACESFRDQEECAVKNSADPCCGCETINIDCKAHNCTYNEHCKCTAASIKSKRSGSVPDGVSAGSYPVHLLSVLKKIRDLDVLFLNSACRSLCSKLCGIHSRQAEAWHVKVHTAWL